MYACLRLTAIHTKCVCGTPVEGCVLFAVRGCSGSFGAVWRPGDMQASDAMDCSATKICVTRSEFVTSWTNKMPAGRSSVLWSSVLRFLIGLLLGTLDCHDGFLAQQERLHLLRGEAIHPCTVWVRHSVCAVIDNIGPQHSTLQTAGQPSLAMHPMLASGACSCNVPIIHSPIPIIIDRFKLQPLAKYMFTLDRQCATFLPPLPMTPVNPYDFPLKPLTQVNPPGISPPQLRSFSGPLRVTSIWKLWIDSDANTSCPGLPCMWTLLHRGKQLPSVQLMCVCTAWLADRGCSKGMLDQGRLLGIG